MKLEEVNVKTLLAIFVVVFGMITIAFIHMEDIVLGAIIGFIGIPLSYFFGASKGNGKDISGVEIENKEISASAPDDIVGTRPKDRG